jgi:PIN domain nuclease of toxin-antitoxin system
VLGQLWSQSSHTLASAWEIIIKVGTGKLILPEAVTTYITSRVADNQFEILPIELSHILEIDRLPDIHRDPFDRIIVAQSQATGMPILTLDRSIGQYGVDTIW